MESGRLGCTLCSFLSKEVVNHSKNLSNKATEFHEGDLWIKFVARPGKKGIGGIVVYNKYAEYQYIRVLQTVDFDPLSQENVARIKTSMETCVGQHQACPSFTARPAPKRLINLTEGDELRLENTEGKVCQYAALSYRWGDPESVRDARTVAHNLKARMSKFSLSELPTTIGDAIRATRALGIRYLWVDSICIVQEPIDIEWRSEAKRMMDYYGNAYLTIVPVASESADAGFGYGETRMSWTRLQAPWYQTGNHQLILARENCHNELDTADRMAEAAAFSSAWSRRAWTYQEQLMSSRILYVLPDRALLDCRAGEWETLGGWDEDRRFLVNHFLPLDADFMPKDADSWWRLVYKFSKKNLTFEKDRYFAFLGIANNWSSVYGRDIILGLRKDVLIEDLVSWASPLWDERWEPDAPHQTGDARLPSWTWMAEKREYAAGIDIIFVKDHRKPRAHLLAINESSDIWRTSLQLRTVFLSAEELLGLVTQSYTSYKHSRESIPYRQYGTARFDRCDYAELCSCRSPHPALDCTALRILSSSSRDVSACLMGPGTIKGADLMYWFFLLVEPVKEVKMAHEQQQAYRRVGALDFTTEFMDKYDPELSSKIAARLPREITLF
ncbi:hypothetical protein CkaCkLH20_04994 [Colletotrichum karsti]|uniref:Heterokaryon incompatibility domain-containing protein n=1 Tax=Colletotrichum karsti TaxID=1095194 RepID=A0A9P6I6S8_9PEZI|nr:uncharacterized protein CkaCkLH20_04994 [Colletotrichum karsti]KAF9877294.1 hypothetical protein CkaCkLH20_04994 [Colletotrichum karsti]